MPFQASADKVNEAYHFLLLMRVAELPAEGDSVPARLQGEAAFRYAFSAFVSAARTVLYLLQDEGTRLAGFTRWYVTARERWLKDELASYFGERREFKLAVGDGGVRVLVPPAAVSHNQVAPAAAAPLQAVETSGHAGTIRFADRPDVLASELCARYLEHLAALVDEAGRLAAP